jgi:hypothetical protein
METRQWAPRGFLFWGLWLYGHLFFKVKLLPSSAAQTITFAYKSSVASQYVENKLTLKDNAEGNFQVITQIKGQGGSNQGQAIRFRISGTHLGGVWNLQYLGFDVLPQDAQNLMAYEG